MKDIRQVIQDLVDIFIDKEQGAEVSKPVNDNIWKSSDGTWQFAGIFSNNYLDKDSKLNILSADSHRKFEKALDDGTVEMPTLRYWHIDVDIGQANQVAFDERGFMIVQGEFYKEFSPLAEALSEWDKPLGMSHRMLPQHITTDPDDDNVIVEYASTEVSFLPVEKAASPLTFFGVQEIEPMLDIKTEKETNLREILGDERLDQLDLMVSKLKEAGDNAGLPTKEADEVEAEVEVEAVGETVEAEVEAEVADEDAVKEEEVDDVEAVEADVEVEDEAEVEDVEPVEVEAETAEVEAEQLFVTNEQLIDVINFVKEAFDGVGEAIADIRKEAEEAKAAAVVDKAQAVEKAQDDVLMASLASMLGSAQSAIGSSAAVVKEGDDLATKAPESVPAEALSFIDEAISSIIRG